MTELYLVSVAGKFPNVDVQQIDDVLNTAQDWLRLNGMTWLVWTNESGQALALRLKARLGPDDTILVLRVEPANPAGWAPESVWNWLRGKISHFSPKNALVRDR